MLGPLYVVSSLAFANFFVLAICIPNYRSVCGLNGTSTSVASCLFCTVERSISCFVWRNNISSFFAEKQVQYRLCNVTSGTLYMFSEC